MQNIVPKQSVLVVEDEHEVRAIVAFMLEDNGFRVLEAADAPEAERVWLADQTIDLVIADVYLPGASGIDLAEVFRSRKPDVKFLFISAFNSRLLEKDKLRMAAPTVAKPFTANELIQAVRQTLNRRN